MERAGYIWVASNWRCAAGELDIVMRDPEQIVVVEVKVRRGEQSGSAEEAISRSKGLKLLATGEWFMAEQTHLSHLPWRIDLVAITIDRRGTVQRINHIPDAVVSG
jgi:putative endonuclease